MSPTVMDHLVVAFLALATPWLAVVEYRALVRRVEIGRTEARASHYRRVVAQEWAFVAFLLAAWTWAGRSLSGLGLGFEAGRGTWAGLGLTLLASAFLVAQVLAVRRQPEALDAVRAQLRPLRSLLPHTAPETRLFAAVSITAGICEEIVYRGFLMAYFGGLGAVAAVVLSSLVFALGHVYLGTGGALRAGAVGVVAGGLYWLTGSLWAPMLLHAVLDVTSGLLARAAFDASPEPAG